MFLSVLLWWWLKNPLLIKSKASWSKGGFIKRGYCIIKNEKKFLEQNTVGYLRFVLYFRRDALSRQSSSITLEGFQ